MIEKFSRVASVFSGVVVGGLVGMQAAGTVGIVTGATLGSAAALPLMAVAGVFTALAVGKIIYYGQLGMLRELCQRLSQGDEGPSVVAKAVLLPTRDRTPVMPAMELTH